MGLLRESKIRGRVVGKGNVTLEQISEKIGDKHDTTKRMVAAFYVLEQAEQTGTFVLDNRKAIKFNFSHLYTALSRTPYMNFLGLDTAWSRYDPTPDPIPSDKLEHLREVLLWIYGSKEENKGPVIQSQNPDIKRLGAALANAEGLHVLRALVAHWVRHTQVRYRLMRSFRPR